MLRATRPVVATAPSDYIRRWDSEVKPVITFKLAPVCIAMPSSSIHRFPCYKDYILSECLSAAGKAVFLPATRHLEHRPLPSSRWTIIHMGCLAADYRFLVTQNPWDYYHTRIAAVPNAHCCTLAVPLALRRSRTI